MSSPAPSLRPVRGTAAEVLALLREWDTAAEPLPLAVETSGSTGRPKRVVLSREAMRASADATHARLGGPGQWLLNLPPAYVAGLQVLFRSVRAGTEPVTDAASMTGERRYLSLVPTQLARALDADPASLRGFDTVLVGGARLEDRLAGAGRDSRRARRRDVRHERDLRRLRVRRCAARRGPRGDRSPGAGSASAARSCSTGTTGSPTPPPRRGGTAGSSPRTSAGSANGRLEVLGRADDVLVSGGVNVPSGAVATRLRAHPRVREAEVVGVPDEEWGELVVAVLEGDVALTELRDWVGAEQPRAWAPRRVVPVDALPLLPNGKVDRLAVQELAGRPGSTGPA